MIVEAVRYAYDLSIEMDRLYGSDEGLGAVQQLAQWVDDGAEFQLARRDFVEHRGEQEEVVAGNQGDFDVRALAEEFFQAECGIHAAETSAQDNYLLCGHATWMPRATSGFALAHK